MSAAKRVNLKIDRAKVKMAIGAGSARGLMMAMLELGRVSRQQVPLDTGALRDSAEASTGNLSELGQASVSDDGLVGCYSYDTKYAVVQHENLSFQHQRGRKAKYLEDPINDETVQNNMLTLASKGYLEFK